MGCLVVTHHDPSGEIAEWIPSLSDHLTLSDICWVKGDRRMSYYRCYLVNGAGQFFNVEGTECESDDDAIAFAKPLLSMAPAVEIWNCARHVALLFPEHVKAALYAVL
jgi:hypothetical protein